MIAASERKISAIGTRLIHAAKDKIGGNGIGKVGRDRVKEDNGQWSQNSTLKLR